LNRCGQHWAKLNYHSQASGYFCDLIKNQMKKYLVAGLCLIALNVHAQKTAPKTAPKKNRTCSGQQSESIKDCK